MRLATICSSVLAQRCTAVIALGLSASSAFPARADELDVYLQRQRDVYQIPAIVVGVMRAGRLTESRAAGFANVELGVPASTQNVFEIGSISKQFTAYAIMMLSEQGVLDLTAPVGSYLTDLPPAWARPTLHQLMGHISGLPDFESAFDYGVYRETPSDAEFQKRLLNLPIESEPGKKWSYSNSNYWLLARVIERVSGRTYAQFMQEEIFVPLGMTATRTALPSQILAGRAAGYRLVDGRLENREPMQPHTGRGLGDIATTIGDMVHWEREQRTPRLLKAETARLAYQPVRLDDGSATAYGYGWSVSPVLGMAARHHSGQTAGFVAEYLRFPEQDLAIVMLANRYGASLAASRIARLVDPSLAPTLPTAVNADAKRQERVHRLASVAARARSEWREEWFGADFWKEIKPYLSDIEDNYRRRGPLQSVTAVGPNGVQDAARPGYRVVFEKATRVMAFDFDEENRIKGIHSEDE